MLAQQPLELARLIHDDVLQTLGVCLLEAELCRRFWKKGQRAQVVEELVAVMEGLEAALETSRPIVDDLRQFAAWSARPRGAGRARPSAGPRLVWAGRAPRSRVDPEEILATISVSLIRVELCRRLFESGEEQPAMVEFNTLLDRLERLVEMYRAVMNELRDAAPARVARSA